MNTVTTASVLTELVSKYDELKASGKSSYKISEVYEDLSIFDWFKDRLTEKDLQEMINFLSTAIVLGYNGYACFKVGAHGCANGMWAHKELSTNGYSPDGDFLYRSFTPDYTYWSFKKGSTMYPADAFDDPIRTSRGIIDLHKEVSA